MAHFDIQNLNFSYPARPDQPVLQDVSLRVERGEFLAVIGKSGSGKTTLLRHLKPILAPHGKKTGAILFEDQPIEVLDLRAQSSRIAYVMQNPDHQIVTDKVWHELAFGLESLGLDQATMRLRVAEMASYFGIQGWFHRSVCELSGGQKQLLNLASAMAMHPDVLILDEPTSQLDPIAASDFLNTVRKINLELGTTVIITEHRLEDIFHAADRVAVMDGGRIIACDAPRAAARKLREMEHDMFAALPAPTRIFYGVEGAESGECPLTVREGRNYLSAHFKSGGASLPEEAAIDDIEDPMLSIREIWYRYEKDSADILRGVNLDVPRGSLFAILGGNGTGKSTLLRAICGVCPPYRGRIQIDGKSVKKYKGGQLFHKMLAMLPQDPQSLFVKKTVREDLAEMVGKGEVARIDEVAEVCEIAHLMNSHPYDLSGGEQQRAALAKVLLTDPQLLLLDEPTKGIDSFFKQKFADILKKLTARGVTVVIVSHDVEFCAQYADLVGMFFDGQMITMNTPRRFFACNSFYTTAANRMSRHVFPNAVSVEDVIALCRKAERI